LELGGIPLKSKERGEDDVLVIAGGPSCFNPEPMAEFIDAFVVGDGEEVVEEIIDLYKKSRAAARKSRIALLRALAKIPGVYVPSLYSVEYNSDGTIKRFAPSEDDIPAKISKRTLKDLDSTYYPIKQIVPNIGIIHDRIAIEVMRGCKHACKFCQAASIYRPCRERSSEKVLELARAAYAATGYDEVSLLSLSSVDYSAIRKVIDDLNQEFCAKAVSISVPSLRIEQMTKDIPLLISKVKKSGLTFAPEAGSDSLRKILGKAVDMSRLFDAVAESFRRGWKRVKLYFMIGLPGETDEDVAKIADMVNSVSDLKKGLDGRPAQVAVSVNAFVPKPHTVFQREAMASVKELEHKKAILRKRIFSRLINLDFHDFGMSYLEATLSRGDRRLGRVIEAAWKGGARFDAWQERFLPDVWARAFQTLGMDQDFYATRPRPKDEILPWEFIRLG
ncbi:MAG: TIGR03960 family B12-binding radical SAM protein, partial [Candidatus Omnitrophica bacterium]|nr:TIGR03960 family B12-binding radical SAM protein [Candidatus Omnitrophota bacterium]